MRNARRRTSRGKVANGNRAVALLTAMLVAVGLTALTMSAVAGADSGATVAKKKKVCPPGTHKVTVKKNGRKKAKCLPNSTTPTPTPTTPAATTVALSCVSCAPGDGQPVAFDLPGADTPITFNGTVTPPASGSAQFTYSPNASAANTTTAQVPVDSSGHFTYTFELKHQDSMYFNTVTASFNGVSTSLSVWIF
jgi:hypothetical protein